MLLISSTIDEYLACKENALTHDTYHWYVWMLGLFKKWCEANNITTLPQITAAHVQQFVSADSKLSANTKHHRAQVVKGFLRWCSLDDETGVRERTVRRIEMPKVSQPEVEIYSTAEIKRLLDACEKTRYPLRNRAIILLLLDTGVRAAELCYDSTRPEEETGLLLEHTILGMRGTESYIIVMGKGRKTRTVKMGNETRLAVQKYINRERPHSDLPYLFLAQGDEPLSVRMLQQFLTNLGKAARVPGTHAHRFRHTFAINQLLAGTADLVLMQVMGHTTLESTKTYIRALSQIQARKASVSVVDEMRKDPKRTRGRK
jgi:site-specific recombinase XerD